MALDELVLPMSAAVFPNLSAASIDPLGGLLLLASVVVLAVGLLSSRR